MPFLKSALLLPIFLGLALGHCMSANAAEKELRQRSFDGVFRKAQYRFNDSCLRECLERSNKCKQSCGWANFDCMDKCNYIYIDCRPSCVE